jgi:hypothetical protein
MTREELLSQPERSNVLPEELKAYDRVVGRQKGYGYSQGTPGYVTRPPGQEAGPYFGALLKAPLIADHISELGVYYRTRGEVAGSFSHADREWVDVVLGQHLGFNMWGHILDGVAVGVRAEAIMAILEHREDELEEDERRFATYIRRFADGRVDDEDWAFVEKRFGPRGAVEYTAWIGHLTMTLRLIQTFLGRTAPSDTDAAVRLRQFIADGEPLPDPRARIPALEYVESDGHAEV